MIFGDFQKLKLPDTPGVYRFLGPKRKLMYIGKATSLRDRVRSYFSSTVITRGKHIEEMVRLAKTVTWEETDSVLDALVLESALIKKYQPPANSKEKDNRSYNYVVVTKEEFPRVLILRERTMLLASDSKGKGYAYAFGPFTSSVQLNEALDIIRHIFPFRDKCIPQSGKPCFNAQIGLCPGVCAGTIDARTYRKTIHHIVLFFEGKKKKLLQTLRQELRTSITHFHFEESAKIKRSLFALQHINDVRLIKDDVKNASRASAQVGGDKPYRIEGYDIAHISGTHTVGVMTVLLDGDVAKSEYRKFKLKGEHKDKAHDVANLREVLNRRFSNPGWQYPDLIVVDGNDVQRRVAETILLENHLDIPVVAVVKDERHKPKGILGAQTVVMVQKEGILLVNAEAHRFAVTYHRSLRERMPKGALHKSLGRKKKAGSV